MLCKSYKKDAMKHVEKIGVIISGLLGDILLRTPVLRALKDIYPNAKIIAITDPIGWGILNYNSYVEKIIVIDRKGKNKFEKNLNKIQGILSIRREKLDLILNLYNGGSSHVMTLLSGARYKLGFCNNTKKYIYNVENKCDEDRLKEAQSLNNYMISIVESLSSQKYSLQPVFEIPLENTQNIKEYLLSFEYDISKIYTLNLASSKEDKILSNEKYFYIVSYIYEKYNFIPAIVCNPSQEYIQENFIKDFLQESSMPFIKLKRLSIVDVASVIDETRFIVTPDTGLMHLAMAFENYILTLFTYTHPVFVDPLNDKFISVYEHFDEGVLYQHQNIKEKTLLEKIDFLFSKL